MERKWTREQEAAIDTHGANLLVAAAAGSGKTAVLVERVIRMVTREENPIDLDRILIVTFTRAAASEMKERIQKAIEEQITALTSGTDEGTHSAALANLKRQAALLPHSFIMTIDSFCSYVVRNYCHTLDMDPDFRVGDQGELTLLQADVMEQLLEEQYQEGQEDFLRFVECYGGARDDQAMEKYISRLYHFSQSDPWPQEWLDRCEQSLDAGEGKELDALPWIQCVIKDVKRFGREAKICLEQGLELCFEEDGPWLYEEMFRSDLETVEQILAASSYEEMYQLFSQMKFVRRPSKKDGTISEEKKNLAAQLRDQGKKTLQDLKKQYFIQPPREIQEGLELLREPVSVLISLTREFGARYALAKAEKNILDFNDLEHCALNILLSREGTETVRQEAARELSGYFEEIMIDEYQDSSLLQEYILNSISREWEGQPNQFMVGDVKQSIYSFRMARPELFIGKYQAYSRLGEKGQEGRGLCIDLSANFRSRSQVLESVNQLFYQIMGPELGEIRYDEAAALYPAASYPEPPSPEAAQTELILIDGQKEIYTDVKDEDYHIRELEAKVIAGRIRQMTDPERGMQVVDSVTGQYRPVRYGDIVILLRSMAGWGQMMRDQLEEAGIPAYMESSTGYFSAQEVQVVLNLLKIIDNPRQDIPLAAVLASPAGGFTPEEMARIVGEGKRRKKKNPGLYDNLKQYSSQTDGLGQKAAAFLERLNRYREASAFMSVHQMVLYVLEDTGYGEFAASMPGGEGRKANLDMLVSYSIHFEQTSYHGLFQFIRYIENLRQYEVDFGAASTFGEQDNIVRITTIHKSKGLEYPVVILAGAGKKFNQQDSREKILFHPVYGVAADLIDLKLRLKLPSLMKKVLQRQMALEQQGEELRILYVAMTRAREKLLITAADSHMETKKGKWESLAAWESRLLPVSVLSQASSFLDWLLMGQKRGGGTAMAVSEADVSQVIGQEILRQAGEQVSRKALEEMTAGPPEDEALHEQLRERLAFRYPGQAETEIYSKLSVSELKEAQEEDAVLLYEGPVLETEIDGEEGITGESGPREEALPGFMREEKLQTATALGTLYHRVAERIDFSMEADPEHIREFLSGMVDQGLLSVEERKRISPYKWSHLLGSSIGRRMGRAWQAGLLFRERPFIMGIPARQLRAEWDSDQLVVVQGIIDAWFIEDGGIIIVDYKTDRVAEGKNLIDRYGKQLYYYKAALEQAEGLPVKECIIYSFHLEEEIDL